MQNAHPNPLTAQPSSAERKNDYPNRKTTMQTCFDTWYDEQCSIDAAEVVGPNSREYEPLQERYYEDETRREAALHRYRMETGDCA